MRAERLLGLRVRIPPGAWIFGLCVLYSKDKRHSQYNQNKEVQIKCRERTKKIPPGSMDVCVVCVLQQGTKGKGQENQDREVLIKYKVRTTNTKTPEGWMCLL